MEIEIIPTLNVESKEDFENRLREIEKISPIVQIDIFDKKFASRDGWADPIEISEMKTPAKYELHLMTYEPFDVIEEWLVLKDKIARVVIHAETIPEEALVQTIKHQDAFDWDICIALNIETPVSDINPILEELRFVMVMGVPLGPSGSEFNEVVLHKIVTLRDTYDTLNIEVDGGVNEENIQRLIDAGANILCCGSAIFNEEDTPENNLKKMRALALN